MPDIFLHIPKTGGMTLATTLKWTYGPGSCHHLPSDGPIHPDQLIKPLSTRRLHQADLIRGHALFGLHQHLEAPCRYFTMLRQPIRRVVSHYYYHKSRCPNSDLAAMSLKQFLQSGHGIAQPNRQVRFVSGKDPEEAPDAALEQAKSRLRNDFFAFGLTDRFDESLLLFRRRLGWTFPPFYTLRKVQRDRPTVEELPADTIQAIRQHNRLDIELYRFAQAHFQRALDETFSDLDRTLRQFRQRNQLFQSMAPPFLWLYRTGRRALRAMTGAGN